MTFTIKTTDGQTFQASEIGHQTDGSITFTDADGRKLRLSGHYWTMIKGTPEARDPSLSPAKRRRT